jgi:SHS2 domain-containing protein
VADIVLEAWGPDRCACFAAAVRGLVAAFADPGDAEPDRTIAVCLAPASDEDLLVRLLEEVIFLVDAEGRVPVAARIVAVDGGLQGEFDTVGVDRVEEVGALPKGVSRTDVEMRPRAGDGWHCRVLVDV